MISLPTHNAGFFSCCTIKLNEIVKFINKNRTLPMYVDSSKHFNWYKTEGEGDVTYKYFKMYLHSHMMQLMLFLAMNLLYQN